MYKKTLAIPARLQKESLTEEELQELSSYGDQPMTEEEIEQRQIDEAINLIDQQREELIRQANYQLKIAKQIAMDCMLAAIEYPPSWRERAAILKQIINTGAGDIPQQPPIPEGI